MKKDILFQLESGTSFNQVIFLVSILLMFSLFYFCHPITLCYHSKKNTFERTKIHEYIRRCRDTISSVKIKYLLTYEILGFVQFNILFYIFIL